MNKPLLVQRCTLTGDVLDYDRMGLIELECQSRRAEAMDRILAAGITKGETEVTVDGEGVIIYMVAGKGFSFTEYTGHLQALANEARRMPEFIYLRERILIKLGKEVSAWERAFSRNINAWFDLENDVFFVLDKEERDTLVKVLERIQICKIIKERKGGRDERDERMVN